MSAAEVFDDYVSFWKIGPRLDYGRLLAPVADVYERHIRRARAALASASQSIPKFPAVYADFVRNSAFNAFAFKHQGGHFIAFHDGLPVILMIVLYRILADRRLFSHVGDPNQEASSLPLIAQLSPDAALLSGSMGAVPTDSRRQIYALYLFNIAFDFLIAHEVAHIANGHVDYRDAELGIPYIAEATWTPDTADANLESQAMELDADSTAARILVNTVKAHVANRGQMSSDIAEFYREPSGAMYDVALAVSIVFRLFQDSRMDGVDVSADSHPPTRWRQMQILNMMGNYVDRFWDSSLVDAVSAAFTKAIAEVENAFELITGTGQQVQGLHDAWGDVGWNYAAKVSDCWNNGLRENVAKYAYAESNSYHFDRPNL